MNQCTSVVATLRLQSRAAAEVVSLTEPVEAPFLSPRVPCRSLRFFEQVMPQHSDHVESDAESAALREIHEALASIARAVELNVPAEEFYDTLLTSCVQATAAAGGAVWYQDADSGFYKSFREADFPPVLLQDFQTEEAHAARLADACRTTEPSCVPHAVRARHASAGEESQNYLLLLCPITVDDHCRWIVELVLQRAISLSAQQGHLRFLAAVRDIAADYHRHAELQQLRGNDERWQELYRLSVDVHQRPSVDETAYNIVNGSRGVLDCDRVQLLECRGNRCHLLSVSGVDHVDVRSLSVRRLATLVEAAIATREPLWYAEAGEALPPQIDAPLHEYLNESHMRQLAVVPLFPPQDSDAAKASAKPFAALVIESKRAQPWDASLSNRVLRVARVCESALAQAILIRTLPFSAWQLKRRQHNGLTPRHSWLKKGIVAALLVSGLVLVGMIPRPFAVSSLGELQPQSEQRIFAVSDGQVEKLHVDHGQECAAGDLLVTLTNSELDFDLKQVGGELQTARARLASVRAAYLGIDRSEPTANERYEELTAEEQELLEKIAGLNEQYEILQTQKSQLEIRSPIDGRVLTWNADQLLQSRPVRRGQLLLTVADLRGPWHVELHVPEEDVGYLIDAQQELGDHLPVTFLLESEPGMTYSGHLETMSLSTSFDEWDTAGTTATITLDGDQQIPARPGARVRAKIAAGERSLAFVWLHDLYAAMQRWLLF